MNTPSSALFQGVRDNVDTGPLSWVIGEIREAFNRSKTALLGAVVQDTDARATALRHARSYLHQAHGALQIVDIDGISIITEMVEDLLDRAIAGQVEFSDKLAAAVGNSYCALVEYLEELLSGMPHQPVRLFPYYRELLEVRDAERIHPADLFFPNLAVRPQLPPVELVNVRPSYYGRLRQQFEFALLPFLKSTDTETELKNAGVMRDIIGEIERLEGNQQTRVFWWVMHGLAEAVSAGQIGNEVYVKQLFARINLQIRRLSQGSSSVAERLLRDALFFIAKAENPSPRAQQIRTAYRLDGLVPVDYESKRYGRIDVDMLATAKERLAQAKGMWNRIASGDAGMAESFEHEMHMLADVGSKLNSEPLTKLLRELKGIARHAAYAKPGEALGLEMATSLLFVESSLNSLNRLPENFAERAEAIIARLLAVMSGEQPKEAAKWLDDMSREAQQRQTMTVLSAEMQNSLRQVEKLLDDYFRDSSRHTSLGQLDTVLHQIEGALAVLDQDDAVQTVQHTRTAVQRFIAAGGDVPPDQQECQQVARNVGALSFFIEDLQLDAEGAKKRFSFDPEQGVLQVSLLEKPEPVEEVFEIVDVPVAQPEVLLPESEALPVQTVEDELAFHQQQSAELAMSLTEQPDNLQLQEQLKESLQQIRLDATLVDNPEANDRAQLGINILQRPDFSTSPEALAEIITATVPVHQPGEKLLPPVVAPSSEEAIDAELLEIFLLEAVEVLDTVREALPLSRQDAHNQEHLTTLRRSFHTLKGSGRMVGLAAFGEAAWSIEQVLNLRLAEARPADDELLALLEKAADVLGGWVHDLKEQGRSNRIPDALIAAAARVKAGGDFYFEEMAVPEVKIVDQSVDSQSGVLTEAMSAEPEAGKTETLLSTLEPDMPPEAGLEAIAGDPPVADGADTAEVSDGLPQVAATLPAAEEVHVSDAEMAVSACGQAEESAGDQTQPVSMPQHEEHAAPVIAIGQVIEFPMMQEPGMRQDDNVRRIGGIEISVALYNIYLAETDDLVRLLARDIAEWRHEPERSVNIQIVHAAHSLAGSSATVGFTFLQEGAHALEMVLQLLARRPVQLTEHEFDTLEQSVERFKLMLQKFALGEMPRYEPEYARLLASIRRDIERRADAVVAPTEDMIEHDESTSVPVPEIVKQEKLPVLSSELPSITQPASFFDIPDVTEQEAVPAATDDTEANSAVIIKDEIDADLLPVFLEEGRDGFPQLGASLRKWQDQPPDPSAPQAMLRLLHTLKGSARMAGAMNLGQELHDLETRVENLMRLGTPSALALEDLLVRYDQALQLFEQLQNPDAGKAEAATTDIEAEPATQTEGVATQPVALSPLMPVRENMPVHVPFVAPAVAQRPRVSGQMVRVRADILDHLVNQAGEVSISRSKLETEVGSLRQSLSELTENVSRLRDQLREIEMQAETQIASRMAQSGDREFDPLEFDRFTRLQELTRMMAESVGDVTSVHQNLSRTLDNASNDLAMQARLTRELQRDLMRVRMVQFASISERLFRVTRQAAKEVDKRVNLDIRGGTVEIDRSVLEKMTGPFEHLLRNAVVHGIEAREARRAAGKNEIGELLIEVRQEGNEVVIRFSDDGQGLNIGRIRDKAMHIGLLANDEKMPDGEVADLIFHPGFSTADEVTELAGRGIGMDVVRSEAAALGGRVSISSEPGKGAHFTIHLPLTLAVTQVVLLSSGGQTYAVPSGLVEQVQQLRTSSLAIAYNDGSVLWNGERVALHYLPGLLGDRAASPVSQHYSPILILKSGNDRVAIHVDEVIGNREVVVKNIGPQLARMVGIAGATVLGSGDIVLILNPIPLALRAAQESQRILRAADGGQVLETMGAVAEISTQQPSVPKSEPVQGLRTQNIVMVVDDSMTVRRVTQRLLAREGYQVVAAKDGVDALEQLQSITPDVMLVDIEMPRMDGFDLTRNVRDDERTRNIPIIMITSRTAAKHRNYAMELGVNAYLGKPYREEELLALIASYIGKEITAAE